MRLLGTARPGVGDAVTLGNACCGAAAVLAVSTRVGRGETAVDSLRLVAILLLIGTMLDVLDGVAARRWGGTSLGCQLDGMADAVTFGVAPAIAVAVVEVSGQPRSTTVLVGLGVCVYVGGALLRLADFTAHRWREANFTGLPSPLAAVAVLDIGFIFRSPLLAAAGLAAVGLLMVSALHYPANGGVIVVLAIGGWAFGIAGLSGLIDVRIPAVTTLIFIVVLIPAWAALDRRRTSETAVPPVPVPAPRDPTAMGPAPATADLPAD